METIRSMKRICINFSTHCNMKCDFCNGYFDGIPFDLSRCLLLIDRCMELGIDIFSFGGGDPFMYPELAQLLEYVKNNGKYVQIDTNGLLMNEDICNHFEGLVDLVSLPLDGSTKERHGLIRGNSKHLDSVLGVLELLSKKQIKLKINTLVSKMNIYDIPNILNLLTQYRIDIWSLYQFWPLHNAEQVKEKHSISRTACDGLYGSILQMPNSNRMKIELNLYTERHGTYLYATPQGSMHINDRSDHGKYLIIGDILNPNVFTQCSDLLNSSIREKVVDRYV